MTDWIPLIRIKQSKYITEWHLVLASNVHRVDGTGHHLLFSLNVIVGPNRYTMILPYMLRVSSFEESYETLDIWHDIISTSKFDTDEVYLKRVDGIFDKDRCCILFERSFDEFKNSFERYYCVESL